MATALIYHQSFHSHVQKVHSPNLPKEKCMGERVRIGSVIIFHLTKLWKAKFSILCDVIFLVRLQGKLEIDHSRWSDFSCSLTRNITSHSMENLVLHALCRWEMHDYPVLITSLILLLKGWENLGKRPTNFCVRSVRRNSPYFPSYTEREHFSHATSLTPVN